MATMEIQPGRRVDLAHEVVGLDRADRVAHIVEQEPGRPPWRIDGLTIGAPSSRATRLATVRCTPMATS